MGFFTSSTFSWLLAGIAGILGILFLIGKGQAVLDLFSSGREAETRKKRTPEQEAAYQRALGIFLMVICANEVLMAMFGNTVRWVPLVAVGVVIVAIVFLALYIRKNS